MAEICKRIGKDGTVSYRVRVRLRGAKPQSATFASLSKAKAWASATESAQREGRHVVSAAERRKTVGELIDRYVLEVLPTKPKSQHKQGLQLGVWKLRIGHLLLADLTPSVIAQERDRLLAEEIAPGKKRNPATVVRYMAALSHALSIARKEWGWLTASPLSSVQRPKENRGRSRFLTDLERQQLLLACKQSTSPHLYCVVVLALSTGMRQGEILHLRWQDVDFPHGRIILEQTKNGDRRIVPVTGMALEMLQERASSTRVDPQGLVFPAADPFMPASIRRAWEHAVQIAGVRDFRFHDLRHTAASYLAMNRATPSEIAEVLGHRTLQMVKRYAHLSHSHVAGVVASMNQKIFGHTSATIPAEESDGPTENTRQAGAKASSSATDHFQGLS